MEPTSASQAKGLFRSLYDFGFNSLITTKIIRFVYGLVVILLSIGAVIFFIGGLASRTARGVLFSIIIVPIGYLLYLIMLRIWMEVLIVVFRIGDDIHAIRFSGCGGGGGMAPGGFQNPQPPTVGYQPPPTVGYSPPVPPPVAPPYDPPTEFGP